MKRCGFGLLAALLVVAGGGCNQSPSPEAPPSPATNTPAPNSPSTLNSQPSTTLARIHWLGKDRIAAQAEADRFMSLWNLPQAARLEAQTLDKLALYLAGERLAVVSNQLSVISNQSPVTSNQLSVISNQSNQPAALPSKPTAAANNPPAHQPSTPQPSTPGPSTPGPSTPGPSTPQLSTLTSPLAVQLRPLLDDLVREECYLDIQQPTNQPAELALAVRLDDAHADLWASNLTAVLAALTNVQSLEGGKEETGATATVRRWRLNLQPATFNSQPSTLNPQPPPSLPSTLSLSRAGNWTLLGLAGDHNSRLDDFAARIQRGETPVAAPETRSSFQVDPVTRSVYAAPASPAAANHWLEVDLDLRRLSRAFALGWNLPAAWPRIAATWTVHDEMVRTTGELTFPTPLDLPLEPWNIPTNLVREPLMSFTAIRGLRPWLASQEWVKQLQIQSVPDQYCAWAGPAPLGTFTATPMPNSASFLDAIAPRVEAEVNPWLSSNAMGVLEYSKASAGIEWSGIPMFTPTLEAAMLSEGGFLVSRVGVRPGEKGKPAPAALYAQLARPNLVYYDWEITGAKLKHWVYLGQTARLAFMLPQMPPDSAAFAFLLAATPKLGKPTGTEVVQDGPATLSFVRNSQSGFTGVEWHLLADWLESPAFPRGFHSLLAPKPVRKVLPHRRGTNSIPLQSAPAARQTNPTPLLSAPPSPGPKPGH